MRRKNYGISESDFWESGRFEHHEHISSSEDYDKAFERGLEQARSYLNQHQQDDRLTAEVFSELHGRLFGEIYPSSGEWREGCLFFSHTLPLGYSELSREQTLIRIAEQHIYLMEENAFPYGNEEVVNLVTEVRMELAFGSHAWQGLDEVDARNWDKAVESCNREIMAGFLENQLQDAINYEQNPLQEFQEQGPEKDPPGLSRKERKEATKREVLDQAQMGDLEKKAEEKTQDFQNANREPVDLSQSTLPKNNEREEREQFRKAQELLDRVNQSSQQIKKKLTQEY